jgi:hypothetical protein
MHVSEYHSQFPNITFPFPNTNMTLVIAAWLCRKHPCTCSSAHRRRLWEAGADKVMCEGNEVDARERMPLAFVPECVANGSRLTLGVWGWRRVRSTPLLRSQASATLGSRRQPSATVGNRQQPLATVDNEVAMAVPMASSAKVVTLGDFKRRVA